MATPADQRLLELLEKWLNSLELHIKYSVLDDDSYQKMQSWPEHQRPSRWILDLARQKALALSSQIRDRVKIGDDKFSDSLELMTFLANLVGSEHIERFIPLAMPHDEDAVTQIAAVDAATGTREMPKFEGGKSRDAAPAGTAQVARTERKPVGGAADFDAGTESRPAAKAAKAPPARPAVGKPGPAAKPPPAAKLPPAAKQSPPAKQPKAPPASGDRYGPSEAAREQVIADAARLVQWGRKWYELAELIASMADRPHVTDVRRILKDNKAVIDKKAGRG